MRLLVDEDSQAWTLVRLLEEAGHDMLIASGAGLNSLSDREVLARAATEERVLLTRNCGDFFALHEEEPAHSGVLAVYQDADPLKSMSYTEIVCAIGNVESSGMAVSGEFFSLNAWSW